MIIVILQTQKVTENKIHYIHMAPWMTTNPWNDIKYI